LVSYFLENLYTSAVIDGARSTQVFCDLSSKMAPRFHTLSWNAVEKGESEAMAKPLFHLVVKKESIKNSKTIMCL